MRHDDIWRAIDTLAAEHGLTASGLARKAGLDPTSFNISKRRTTDGRQRWPSTESLAKVLAATGAGLEAFTTLVTGARALPDSRRSGRGKIPLIGLAQAGNSGFFDDGGYPAGAGWDEVDVPQTCDANAYALNSPGAGGRPGGGPRHQRRRNGQTAAPPYRHPRRTLQPEPGASRPALRNEGDRVDAPDHLGQPVGRTGATARR